jgi:hypothetical protein
VHSSEGLPNVTARLHWNYGEETMVSQYDGDREMMKRMNSETCATSLVRCGISKTCGYPLERRNTTMAIMIEWLLLMVNDLLPSVPSDTLFVLNKNDIPSGDFLPLCYFLDQPKSFPCFAKCIANTWLLVQLTKRAISISLLGHMLFTFTCLHRSPYIIRRQLAMRDVHFTFRFFELTSLGKNRFCIY